MSDCRPPGRRSWSWATRDCSSRAPTATSPGVPNAVRREALNRAADTLDAALADAAGRFRGQFVDVRAAFAGHGVCSADPWITPPPASAPAIYHPTPQGYRDGYLPAFEAAVTRP